MSYLAFHLCFNLPTLLLLGWLALPTWTWVDTQALLITSLIVMVFTSPWDNWAIARGIWDFPESRLIGRILKCPLEEYAFFLIQTTQACLLAHMINWQLILVPIAPRPQPDWLMCGVICGLWLLVGLVAALSRVPRKLTYLWHLLFWMLPVVFLQWAVGGQWIMNAPVVLGTTLLLGTLLCVFDIIAIREGIWFFDDTQTLGWRLGGVMPVEEALFFYITSLLVAQSYLLFL